MKKDLTELTELNALEVSLVDAGANKKKRFPVFKQEKENMDQEILKAVLETEVDEEASPALGEWLEKQKISEKGQAAVRSVLRMLSAYKDELPKDVLDKLADVAGYPMPKAKAAMPEDEEDKYPMPKDKTKKKDEEVCKMEQDKTPELDEIQKAQATEIDALRKQNEEINKKLKAETDKRELAEWIQKAENDLSHYPGKSSQELGTLLKGLHDKDPEFAKQQFEVFKSASDAFASSGILGEAGRSGALSGGGSAWDKVEKMAEGLVEKSEDIHMTKEKAVVKVLEARPDLYSQYLRENPAQTAPVRS